MFLSLRSLLLLSIATASVAVSAGPLLDAMKARREARQAESSSATEPDGESEMTGRRGRLKGKVALPPGARLESDIAYGSDKQQRLDVYIPAGARSAPIIFMVHGGAWILGDKAYLPVVENKVARWLPKGYIVVSVNYRMSRSPKVLDQAQDVASAMAYVQDRAATWGGDRSRILAMGHSAGAHLISLLAVHQGLTKQAGAEPWMATISLDSAVLDVKSTMDAKHYGFYDKVFGKDKALWTAASPIEQLTRAPKPMLLVCATGRPDSCPQAEAFAAKGRDLGAKIKVMPVEMKHGDINTDLGRDTPYTASVEAFFHEVGLP